MKYSGYGQPFNFTIHLSTSDLVSMLVVDSEALRNEHHDPGVYDEDGDYVPQYSDDPNDLRYIGANSSDSPVSSQTDSPPGTAEGDTPSSTEPSSSEPTSGDE